MPSQDDPDLAFRQSQPLAKLTLRDWFAGQALPALLDNRTRIELPNQDEVARRAYDYADAMLKARAAE